MVTLTIDNKQVSVPAGTTILDAAWRFRLFLISAVAAPGTDRLR